MPEDLATQQLKQALVDNNIDINVVTNKEIKDALKQISISSNEATKQYNQINGFVESDKPTQEEIDEANRQYNEVVAKYKDTELWLKAPNGEPTNLTEQQSVQVRTLNFKKWFGDWEKAKIRERLEGQKPVLVEAKYHIEEPKERKAKAIALFDEDITVKKTIGYVNISKSGIRKSFGHSTSDAKLDVVPYLREILEKAEFLDVLHDFDGKDIQNYYFATRITHDDQNKIVFLRARKMSGRRNQLYVHDVFLEENIKQKVKNPLQIREYGEKAISRLRNSDLYKNILYDIYSIDNESVSKIVDENGEPLVVYHGSTAIIKEDFAFDYQKIGEQGSSFGYGFYFTTNKATAMSYAKNNETSLIQAFVNMKKPLLLDQKPFNKEVMKKIVKRTVDIEMEKYPDEFTSWKDTFLSSYADTYSNTLSESLNQVVTMINHSSETVIDQLAEVANASGSKDSILKAERDIVGFDGVKTKGYGDNEVFYITWFPENVKSVDNIGTFTESPNIFQQQDNITIRGVTSVKGSRLNIQLLAKADHSTFIHEAGHFMLESMSDLVKNNEASACINIQ